MGMIEYFFNYEIQHYKDRIISDCANHGCYANIELIETICNMYKTSNLTTYASCVEDNPFIHPCMQKHILDILCRAIQKKNVLTSICIRYLRKRRSSYVTTDLALNPLSETNPKYLIDIMHNYKKYTFKLFDLANIIFNSLTKSDENFFSNPLVIKNPYTNIKFSVSNLYIIYFCMQKRGLFIHPLFTLFMQENFNLALFSLKHEGLIKEYIIDNTLHKETTNKICQELRTMFNDLTIYNTYTMVTEPILSGMEVISNELLITFKPLLYHYYHSLFSMNSYYRQVEYNKLIKKIIAFKNENPLFIVTNTINVPITKVNYKHITIPRRPYNQLESLLLIS
jgi:hypothetical protein